MMIAGYAALFDVIDDGGDIIRAGAFAGMRQRATKLLRNHDYHRAIGKVIHLEEDERGLQFIARLNNSLSISVGQGLSFGYRVLGYRSLGCGGSKYIEPAPSRELLQVELIEVSVTDRPMQGDARVIAVCANDNQAALMARFGEVRRG